MENMENNVKISISKEDLAKLSEKFSFNDGNTKKNSWIIIPEAELKKLSEKFDFNSSNKVVSTNSVIENKKLVIISDEELKKLAEKFDYNPVFSTNPDKDIKKKLDTMKNSWVGITEEDLKHLAGSFALKNVSELNQKTTDEFSIKKPTNKVSINISEEELRNLATGFSFGKKVEAEPVVESEVSEETQEESLSEYLDKFVNRVLKVESENEDLRTDNENLKKLNINLREENIKLREVNKRLNALVEKMSNDLDSVISDYSKNNFEENISIK